MRTLIVLVRGGPGPGRAGAPCTGDSAGAEDDGGAGVGRSAGVLMNADEAGQRRGHAPNYEERVEAKEGIRAFGDTGLAVTSNRSGAVPK